MADLWDNPMVTDGFEFVEYTAPDPGELRALFERLGFRAVARHRSKDVTLYRQGGINFIVNAEPDSFGQSFARVHGPSACAMAFRVKDAARAYKRALELGAKAHHGEVGPMELNIPAIRGIGGSLIYLVDRYGERSIYDVDFVPLGNAELEHFPRHGRAHLTVAAAEASVAMDSCARILEMERLAPHGESHLGSADERRDGVDLDFTR